MLTLIIVYRINIIVFSNYNLMKSVAPLFLIAIIDWFLRYLWLFLSCFLSGCPMCRRPLTAKNIKPSPPKPLVLTAPLHACVSVPVPAPISVPVPVPTPTFEEQSAVGGLYQPTQLKCLVYLTSWRRVCSCSYELECSNVLYHLPHHHWYHYYHSCHFYCHYHFYSHRYRHSVIVPL